MAGKEAIVVVLDVGSTMIEKYSKSNQSRLELGIESIKLLIQQKLHFTKNHEVGLVLYGTEETENSLHERLGGYENVCVAKELAIPTLDFLKHLDNIKATPQSGDWIDAIVVATDMLITRCQKKKYNKRIFLITDGQSNVGRTEDLREVAENFNAAEIKLNVIAIDFCNDLEFDTPEEKKKASENETPVQQNNKRILQEFIEKINGKIFPANVAMNIYKQFRKKQIHPVAKYRGTLEISKDLNIQVLAFSKTRNEPLPSLSKYSLVSEETKKAGEGKVKMERVYTLVDDPDQTPIIPGEKIKGYNYGKQIVPVNAIDEKLLIHEEAKCLKLLGFADKDKIKREHYMGGVEMLLSTQDKENSTAFSSLIHAMEDTKKVMICRFVYRNNNIPHIVCLSPHISSNYECLFLNYLPTIEDLREYQFPGLKESTEEQQKAAGDFIDSLDLCATGEEELKPKTTFNPIMQYLYQCIQHRALHPDDKSLPELDENIAAYIKPDKDLFAKAEGAVLNFAKAFDLKKVVKTEAEKKKKRVYWRDLISKEESKDQAKVVKTAVASTVHEEVKEKGKDAFEPEELKEISAVDPISDFKKMIGERHRDRVAEAIGQMKKIINRLIEESLVGSSYDRALECIVTLRDSCVKEDEPTEFNDFLYELRDKCKTGKHKQMWELIASKKITLITKEESINSLIGLEEGKAFLNAKEETTKQEKKGTPDNLMDEIE